MKRNLDRAVIRTGVASCGLALVMASCGSEKEFAKISAELEEIKEQRSEIARENRRLYEIYQGLQNEVRKSGQIQYEIDQLQPQIPEIESYLNDLKAAVTHVNQGVSIWKKPCRDSLIGLNLGNFPTAEGKQISAAVLREIKDDGIEITHADGEGFVPYDSLPESIRVKTLHEGTLLTLEKMKIQ